MKRPHRRALLWTAFLAVLAILASLGVLPVAAREAPPSAPAPPGFNVHEVLKTPEQHVFWRGGAPRPDTIQVLLRDARARGVHITFIDLRVPPSQDDLSGKGGRLSPAREAETARQHGLHYVPISALDAHLNTRIDEALGRGDVYIHCMYGVNRTGFAMARFARSHGVKISHSGLGSRDWKQGDAFEARREHKKGEPQGR